MSLCDRFMTVRTLVMCSLFLFHVHTLLMKKKERKEKIGFTVRLSSQCICILMHGQVEVICAHFSVWLIRCIIV